MNGRAFIFGDDIDTDIIAPGGVLHKGMDEIRKHSMEALVPNFHEAVKEGDIIVAGKNFGCGSSREQAPIVLKEMGINLILAKSFSRLFFRNAVNIGLSVGILEGEVSVPDGKEVQYSLEDSFIIWEEGKSKFHFESPAGILKEIISDGGLINYVKKQLKK